MYMTVNVSMYVCMSVEARNTKKWKENTKTKKKTLVNWSYNIQEFINNNIKITKQDLKGVKSLIAKHFKFERF